jgi:tryptophanyl-tRNA synthetase
MPVFKQYREADGRFYFKLVGAGDAVLLQSEGFDQGRDAGQWVARLKKEGAAALAGAPVRLEAGEAAVHEALARFQDAD